MDHTKPFFTGRKWKTLFTCGAAAGRVSLRGGGRVGWGGVEGLIRRHVRKIREGKQALGKHSFDATVRANANANVLPGRVASALEGTASSISFSAVTLDEDCGSDASPNCATLLRVYRWSSTTRWFTMVVYFMFSSIENTKCALGV